MGDELRYCYELGKWLIWNGRRWKVDDSGGIHRKAKDTVRRIGAEAMQIYDETERRAMLKWAMTSESRTRQRDLITLAESHLPVAQEQLDMDPWLLNVQNGTLDLRTGKLMPHSKEQMLTKICPVEYRNTTSKLWDSFLKRVLPDPKVRAFVQRAVGYSLTGGAVEKKCSFSFTAPGEMARVNLLKLSNILWGGLCQHHQAGSIYGKKSMMQSQWSWRPLKESALLALWKLAMVSGLLKA